MRRFIFALAIVAVAASAHAQRTLSWRAWSSDAALDADGELRVTETHRMLFSGDWNGGERVFDLRPGQSVQLLSVTRIDRNGRRHEVKQASGSPGMDEYSFDGSRLRWRARRASDPEFRNSELTYEIAYALRGVVQQRDGAYALNHDFAVADRPGVIERYSLKLSIDEAWKPDASFTPVIERTDLAAGQTVAVRIPLTRTAATAPAHVAPAASEAATETAQNEPVAPPPSLAARALGAIIVTGISLILLGLFINREQSLGRYDPHPQVDEAWLADNIFVNRPELIGTAWDHKVDAAEVSALLASMAMEGKIRNLGGTPPKLQLLVPRHSLPGYEWAFADALFVKGDVIDPDAVREHYASDGFDPAAAIRTPLQEQAQKLTGTDPSMRASGFGCLLLLALSLAVPFVASLLGNTRTLPLGIAGAVAAVVSLALARSYTFGPARGRAIALALPLIAFAAAMAFLVTTTASLALLAVPLTGVALLFASCRGRGTDAEREMQRKLRAARAWLKERLERRDIPIPERWVPYMFALELAKDLDRWTVAGASSGSDDDRSSSSSSSESSRPSLPSFTSGGGGFGGAGATGSWAAMSAFAASIPSPSSDSSSDSSSSSSSSDSGGGSAGGW